MSTEGHNYIALDDDVWLYTGVTSIGGDESNVGFVLMNSRTKETKYYQISGAKEYSAMSSERSRNFALAKSPHDVILERSEGSLRKKH